MPPPADAASPPAKMSKLKKSRESLVAFHRHGPVRHSESPVSETSSRLKKTSLDAQTSNIVSESPCSGGNQVISPQGTVKTKESMEISTEEEEDSFEGNALVKQRQSRVKNLSMGVFTRLMDSNSQLNPDTAQL